MKVDENGVVSGTETRGVRAPTLTELKSRSCTKDELQSALVQLIELVNYNAQQSDKINASVKGKADKGWRATV